MTQSITTYDDRPVVKEPVWIWAVPAYFYAGGAAGAAAVLGAIAQVVDRDGLARLIQNCRQVAFGGIAVGSALLVYDLGRPARFLNMLRVFRPTSAMSVGSWLLAAGAGASTVAVVGRRSLLGDGAGLMLGLVGLPLSGYTAVLLSDTSVPLWSAARRSLPALFVASGASSAAALIELFPLEGREAKVVKSFGTMASVAEAAAMVAIEKDVRKVERVGRPLSDGVSGSLWSCAKAAVLGELLLSFLGRSRTARRVAGVMASAGALALRFGIFHAGKASARDPRATFEAQRGA